MGMTITSLVFLAFVLITIAKGVRIIPQGEEWIVQRLGKYRVTLMPGLRFIIPYFDTISYKVTTKDIILDVQEQEVITRDNAVIVVNAIAFIKVTDPVKAVYGVEDYSEAIRNMIMTTLRSIVGEMELDQALSQRDMIKARLKAGVADEALDWGLTVKSVEIQDIKPSESMQRAMELQAAAERERKAMVTKAEGEKQSMILTAEARLESARRDAAAQVMLAEASSQAITKVTASFGDNELPMLYLLGEKYITSMTKLAESPNAKLVLLPADLQSTLRGLFQKVPKARDAIARSKAPPARLPRCILHARYLDRFLARLANRRKESAHTVRHHRATADHGLARSSAVCTAQAPGRGVARCPAVDAVIARQSRLLPACLSRLQIRAGGARRHPAVGAAALPDQCRRLADQWNSPIADTRYRALLHRRGLGVRRHALLFGRLGGFAPWRLPDPARVDLLGRV